jgi:hypothetical protein
MKIKWIAVLAATFLVGTCLFVRANSPLSLPSRQPVACSAQTGCFFLTYPNTTVFVVARFGAGGTVKGTLGETWTRDQCGSYTGTCIFHASFSSTLINCQPSCAAGDKLSFSGDQFSDVLILIYDGLWGFDAGNFGDYDNQNSAFPDCANGGDCPYAWTLPIDTEYGALIISWGEAGGQIIRPGPWYTFEGKGTYVFVEDLIAPATGVYTGTWMLRNPDGSESGGAHWLAGIAAYKR